MVGVGRDDRWLAPARRRLARLRPRLAPLPAAARRRLALVDPEADLAHGHLRWQQRHRPLGEAAPPDLLPERRAQRDLRRPELRVQPALLLRALAPRHARDPARLQCREQLRAPALAIERQRQARLLLPRSQPRLQQPQRLQLRHDCGPQLRHHPRVHLLVQAQQRRASRRMHPVACGRRQLQPVPRHEVLRQVRLAVVHLHVPVDKQRRDIVGGRADPLPRQLLAPGLDRVLAAGQLAELAPQGVGRAAAVESQQAPPFAGQLVAQALGIAHARQQQESLQQQDRALAVVARYGAQPVAVAQQAGLQQGRQGRQDAASGDGLDRFETRRRGAQAADAGRHAPRDVAGRHAERGGRVELVARAPGDRRRGGSGTRFDGSRRERPRPGASCCRRAACRRPAGVAAGP